MLVEIVATTVGDGFAEAQPLTGPYPSGAPAIFASQVGRLGVPITMVGRVGDDDFGNLNVKRLGADGVDMSGIEVVPGEVTACAFVRYRADGSRRFVFTLPQSAAAALPPMAAADAAIAACNHVHVVGSALGMPGIAPRVLEAADAVLARGGTLSVDPNLRLELASEEAITRLARLVERATIYLPSGDELFLLSDGANEEAALADLLARGVQEIVVKRGAAGASYHASGMRLDVPGVAVDEVDPTGAGDCFGAAFVAMRRTGADPETALRYANAAGALAVTRLGPMEGAATRAEIEALLERAP